MYIILEIPEREGAPSSCNYCFFNKNTSYPCNYPFAAISDKRTYGGCSNVNTACEHIKSFTTEFSNSLFCSKFDTNNVKAKSVYITNTDVSG